MACCLKSPSYTSTNVDLSPMWFCDCGIQQRSISQQMLRYWSLKWVCLILQPHLPVASELKLNLMFFVFECSLQIVHQIYSFQFTTSAQYQMSDPCFVIVVRYVMLCFLNIDVNINDIWWVWYPFLCACITIVASCNALMISSAIDCDVISRLKTGWVTHGVDVWRSLFYHNSWIHYVM